MPSAAAALASQLGAVRAKEAGQERKLARAVQEAAASREREEEARRVAEEQRYVIKNLSKQLDAAQVGREHASGGMQQAGAASSCALRRGTSNRHAPLPADRRQERHRARSARLTLPAS
jgi:hypothetical protein